MIRTIALAALLSLALAGCMSKAEVKTNVQAWRSFTDAVAPDLKVQYGALPEPSRSTRLKTIDQNEQALEKAEVRVGLRDDSAPIATGG